MLIIDFVVLEWLNDKARFFFIFVLTRGTPVVKPHVVSSACVKPQNLFFLRKLYVAGTGWSHRRGLPWYILCYINLLLL